MNMYLQKIGTDTAENGSTFDKHLATFLATFLARFCQFGKNEINSSSWPACNLVPHATEDVAVEVGVLAVPGALRFAVSLHEFYRGIGSAIWSVYLGGDLRIDREECLFVPAKYLD